MSSEPAQLRAHPCAEILPLLEGEPFDELVADIRANGLLHPITVCQGMILDGRNRFRACEAAGVEPRFVKFDGDDPLSFVLSLNVHRRQLFPTLPKIELFARGEARPGWTGWTAWGNEAEAAA
jgi:ParB-like chromosome segregation protein Spo0J